MRIAINGYGRIGRCILRALYESGRYEEVKIVGINELSDLPSIAHLTKFDSTHGKFCKQVSHDDTNLLIEDDIIRVSNVSDPSCIDWKGLDVDMVFECSGRFTDRKTAEQHLKNGASKVLFSCPAQPDVDATIVFGLNEHILEPGHTVISNASCTTNCISHVIQTVNENFGIENGVITTIHSMMNDQPVIDAYHNPDMRKSRSSSNSIIPVQTALAKGIDRVFPELADRFRAVALRVPTLNVSTMQLTAAVKQKCTAEEINNCFADAARSKLAGILDFTTQPLVSCDFNHDPHSCIVDGSQTSVCDNLVNIISWFDNEWGYANRMLDTACAMFSFRTGS